MARYTRSGKIDRRTSTGGGRSVKQNAGSRKGGNTRRKSR